MNAEEVRALLEAVRGGALDPADAERRLRASPPFADLGFANVDHHRALRQGHPEIVYGPGKHPDQVAAIAFEVARRGGRVLVTRTDDAQVAALREALPEAEHDPIARTVLLRDPAAGARTGVVIVSAGTADQGAAREALQTSRYLGEEPEMLVDVGVAGIHRLLARQEELQKARVVVAVAGMEGALASVVGGLVGVPVVGLPTSVGYGAGAGGLAALLAMLNSCASNVCCVNIDNGVGAAVVASLINRGAGPPIGAAEGPSR